MSSALRSPRSADSLRSRLSAHSLRSPLPALGRGALALLVSGALLLTSGCVMFKRSSTARSSSVVAYLFPEGQPPPQTPGMPVLRLPLKVGIAFVPDEARGRGGAISEQEKHVLLERIAADFRSQPFVHSIQTIPTLYLRPGGSFTNLDQVQRLLGIDVIVLLSYDQTQISEQNRRALAYWTIIGAYFVNGNQNDTHTLLEATVYDVASRTLLFHAPGADLTRATSNFVTADRELRDDRTGSFHRATNELVNNLQTELATFRQNVKEGRSEVKVEHRPGYSGGGALDGTLALGGALLLGAAALATRRSAPAPVPCLDSAGSQGGADTSRN